MTDFPITPSPELVQQWANHSASVHRENGTYEQHEFAIATQAARWGADQELEACCEWFQEFYKTETWVDLDLKTFRAARRPKPPSLKEQAKFAAAVLRSPGETCSIAELQQHWHTICCALEELND